jgi:hypothetical protein
MAGSPHGGFWTKAYRATSVVAALCGVAQAWVTYDWIGDLGNHCDYPDECLTSWLPLAFPVAQSLWISAMLAATVSMLLAIGLARPRGVVIAWGVAWSAALVAYVVQPVVLVTPGRPIVDYRQVEGNPFFWGGPGYTLTSLLMVAASLTFAWQALDVHRPRKAVRTSRQRVMSS